MNTSGLTQDEPTEFPCRAVYINRFGDRRDCTVFKSALKGRAWRVQFDGHPYKRTYSQSFFWFPQHQGTSVVRTLDRYIRDGKFYFIDPETGEEVESPTSAFQGKIDWQGVLQSLTPEEREALERRDLRALLEAQSLPEPSVS